MRTRLGGGMGSLVQRASATQDWICHTGGLANVNSLMHDTPCVKYILNLALGVMKYARMLISSVGCVQTEKCTEFSFHLHSVVCYPLPYVLLSSRLDLGIKTHHRRKRFADFIKVDPRLHRLPHVHEKLPFPQPLEAVERE